MALARSDEVGIPTESDHALLTGTPQTFARFYRRHSAAVFAYLLRASGERDLALDLLAETFAAAWLARGKFRPASPSGRGWLLAIAANKLTDSRRKRRAELSACRRLGLGRPEITDFALERAEELVDIERASYLALLVDDLPYAERDALLARVVNERDYSEIAAEQGISEPTLRKRVSRGLNRLEVWSRREER